jgi:hypothetical protein
MNPNPSNSFRVVCLSVVLPLLTGCVSSRFQEARKDTPPPQMMNVVFAPGPVEANLNTVITYNGAGSWKRNAFWDEYVVTVHNPGTQALTIDAARLTDFAGTVRTPGENPWELEKLSKSLEQKYRDAGVAFVRYTAPGLIIVGSGVVVIGEVGIFSAAASTAALVTVVAIPVYYVSVVMINHYNKVAMEKEFSRRRHALPLILAPGETRTGSLFFPMVPGPRTLALHWSSGSDSGEAILSLDFLKNLHVKAPTSASAR